MTFQAVVLAGLCGRPGSAAFHPMVLRLPGVQHPIQSPARSISLIGVTSRGY
jgi:hypothetical protein